MKPYNVMLIENSIGLSGSTISLCNLVSKLDPRMFVPYVVMSRSEQESYLHNNFDRSIKTKIIRCKDSLKALSFIENIVLLAEKVNPYFKRLLLSLISLLDVFFVIVPYTVKLYLFARKSDIDIVHHNNGFDIGAIFLACLLRKPIIAYQRGAEWNSFLVRLLSKLVDLFIANSLSTKESLLSIGIPRERITVIYPPVDSTRFDYRLEATAQRCEFGVRDYELCFGIIGTLLEWKGHRVFLKAACKVLRVIAKSKAFIIGDAPDGSRRYKEELLGIASELGIKDRVIFTGFRADIPELIKMLDVVVHCSLETEPFGRVIVEAMFMKKPVVASLAGGPLEIIRDGLNGFLVSPGDDEKLAEKIILLLRDRMLARRIGDRAHRDAIERFCISSHIEMMHRIYKRFLKKGQ